MPSTRLRRIDKQAVKSPELSSTREIFAGGGEMGARMRALDWSSTPLGDTSTWQQSLKTVVRVLLTSRFAMWMSWGPDLTFLYNDAYARMTLGEKHPWALGKPSREVWAEIWDDIGPRIQKVLDTGEATWDQALMLFLERSGYREETYHTFSYSPLTGDHGEVAGHLCVVSEETERVIGERRLATLRSLASNLSTTATEQEVMAAIEGSLGDNTQDLPFTLTYLFSDGAREARLTCGTGIPANHPAAPERILVDATGQAWPVGELLKEKTSVRVDNLAFRFPSLPTGYWDGPPTAALLAPIASQAQEAPAGFIIAALNPYRQLDASYSGFIGLVAGQIAGSLANARAYEQEKKRAEALAELDRAKTTFFSNVSHEFRTPLTLMLGPTEDALASRERALRGLELETVHRSELRLLKLVNTLLDFSRLEAGRARAAYETIDLASFTIELASVFRSAIERAGLAFCVEIAPLSQSVYIDSEMWEKIVLNLLSNALKSTFEGAITITLREAQDHLELSVRDTGTGIPEDEVAHLFERFRRIEGAKRRTHEGSGIGLALVHELVKLHGGAIAVRSKIDKGTTFTVSIPFGKSHLPEEQVVSHGARMQAATARAAFVQEALSWTSHDSVNAYAASPNSEHDSIPSPPDNKSVVPRVLIVDDNRDMREYLERLLSGRFEVFTAENGRIAWEAATRDVPDLVLSDVMMPEMDGFELLSALRKDPATASIPVILLSARAGEESHVEGMEAGADDYLVKPFTARELLARVQGHINIARFRREAIERETRLQQELDEARRRVSEAVEKMSDGFFMLDSEWRFTYANPAGARMALAAGGSESLIGTTLWQNYPDALGTEIERNYVRCMQHRVPAEFEAFYARRHYHIRAYPAPNGGIVIYSADVSARRKAELDLRIKQAHLVLLQQSAQIGQWELDLETEELSISPEFAGIAGLPPYVSRLRYKDFLQSLFVDTDRNALEQAMKKVLQGRKEFSLQLRLCRPDSTIRLVTIRGKAFFNQGKPLVLGALIDITPATDGGGSSKTSTRRRAASKSRSRKIQKRR